MPKRLLFWCRASIVLGGVLSVLPLALEMDGRAAALVWADAIVSWCFFLNFNRRLH